MNKYTKQIQQYIKENNNKEVCIKALPTDIMVYKVNIKNNKALISWNGNEQKWFSCKKIIYCSLAWLGVKKYFGNILSNMYYYQFKKQKSQK